MESNESASVPIMVIWPLVTEGLHMWRGHRSFDSTLGFPGEGWQELSLATWNTRSLTYERFQFCNSLQYDALTITELWRNQSKFQTRRKKFIVSDPKLVTKGPRKGEMRYPDDKAAGVGILLSDRLEKKVTGFGSEGEHMLSKDKRPSMPPIRHNYLFTASKQNTSITRRHPWRFVKCPIKITHTRHTTVCVY